MTDEEAKPPRDDDYPDVLPDDTRTEFVIEAVGKFLSLLPSFAGILGNVLTGWSANRKQERVLEVLDGLALRLANLRSQVVDEYVRSEEFEDLLDHTLRRVAGERHEEKRRLYRGLLLSAMTSVVAEYDEQLRFLRVIEELQAAHVRVLRALLQPPVLIPAVSSSQLAALRLKMPGVTDDRIADLVAQLDNLGVVNGKSLRAAISSVNTRAMLTAFGQRFVTYVLADREANA